MYLTYKFSVHLSAKQHVVMDALLEVQRTLYNRALAEKATHHFHVNFLKQVEGPKLRELSLIDQMKVITKWRKSFPELADISVELCRGPIVKVDEAYKSFFNLYKKDKKARPPGPVLPGEWSTLVISELKPQNFPVPNKFRIKGIPGTIKLRFHRTPPKGVPKRGELVRVGRKWTAHFVYAVEDGVINEVSSPKVVGVDVGIKSLAVLSDGTEYENIRTTGLFANELSRLQRKLERAKKGSRNRRELKDQIRRLHRKIANTRKTHLHQVSSDILTKGDVIAVEALNVKGLMKSRLAKSIADASFTTLKTMLQYKGERDGIRIVEVDPRYTSQTCSGCGQIVKKTLSERVHACDCGVTLDRDHNAAIVIAQRAVHGPSERKTAKPGNEISNGVVVGGVSALENNHSDSGKSVPVQEVTSVQVDLPVS